MPSNVDPILATADLPGTGGRFKATPEDFEVLEVPLYEAEGEGEHLYVEIRRREQNTRDVVRRLARMAGISDRDVGCAGLKDRNAVATQTFSLAVKPTAEDEFLDAIRADERLELIQFRRHRNKLGRGHLLGNRFRIRLRDVLPDSESRARAVLDRLVGQGLPNYFGAQRYGRDGMNAERGAGLVAGGRERDRFLRELYLHAWQSRLFDRWLAARMQRDDWTTVIEGDIARIEGRGGLFLVEDAAVERPRAERGEISATGPMPGGKMMSAQGQALEVEREALGPEAFDSLPLQKLRLPGSRRAARIFPRDQEIENDEETGSLLLSFFLPKGSYATSVLREVMKTPDLLEDLPELEG